MAEKNKVDITKNIDFANGVFQGESGKKYYINTEYFPVRRYYRYLIYAPMVQYGLTLEQSFNAWKFVYECSTAGDGAVGAFHKISTKAYNMMQATKGMAEKDRHPAVMWLCSLFCNTKDEDVGDYQEAHSREKIQDWQRIHAPDFLVLAGSSFAGLARVSDDLKALEEMAKKRGLDRIFSKENSQKQGA